jgi:hypothetical protein
MRKRFTLRALFGVMTLACGVAAAITIPQYGIFPLLIVALATLAAWPWLFGHGG